jgi:hypothetical protein
MPTPTPPVSYKDSLSAEMSQYDYPTALTKLKDYYTSALNRYVIASTSYDTLHPTDITKANYNNASYVLSCLTRQLYTTHEDYMIQHRPTMADVNDAKTKVDTALSTLNVISSNISDAYQKAKIDYVFTQTKYDVAKKISKRSVPNSPPKSSFNSPESPTSGSILVMLLIVMVGVFLIKIIRDRLSTTT